MKTRRRGRTIALTTGLCVLVIGLAVIVWYREAIRASYALWVNFERLPDSERGYAEYRHSATGMIFVRLPGGKVFVPTYDPPRVEIGPFLIAKEKVGKADWETVLGQYPGDLVTLENCREFCSKVGLSLPTDVQSEHSWDRLAIPEDASNLKPVLFGGSVLGRSGVKRYVHAGFHPVFNLFETERNGDHKNRVRDVVSVVQEFLKYVENSDYDHAVKLGTRGEFTRDGLAKFGKVFDLSQARVVEAYLGKKHAAVMTNPIPRRAEDRTTQFGLSLLKSGDRWLIRDSDRLPDEQWKQKWLAGFRGVEPDAVELSVSR